MYSTYRSNYRNSYPIGAKFSRSGDDRFFAGGFVAPLLLGGIAGYALGRPNYYQYPTQVPYPYPYPVPYPTYPNYYNNPYYYPFSE